ncbi:mediator of RNA polymerase II transcription subunit 14-like isoform X2 [Gigantopelta aegis]|uniref:mediator of RNA polymerase II transcription subunit 14-like isoform X2 n=1 Tax=Gigantopelta aegis TaxID=1735272 RepID=UPI001B88A81A|nr:mediator of RNA polymerase II transcription subunit 14-like isoform X2 [Gigantopelta aegis]
MPPTESLAVPSATNIGGVTISLSTIIDYILQRTHHELTVLSELLPRKTDMERKIEIFQFASRTRQLFIRLLALVKWATSASKVDKCTDICNFLEQQSMFFIDTADHLAKVARETLVTARLPCFSLPVAIDVLTTGTYPRLPTCIREKIVPPDPITPQEKNETLCKLNQVIQYRLVSSELPPQMRKLKIEHGRVKFPVEHEFEVTLTLMGDSPSIPWRLLDIDILVEDHETGDGKSLVHSLQVHYIHQLIQNRLLDNDRPLHVLYKMLHSFCQSLQLEVLHSQTQRLIHNRLGDSIRVEEYTLSKSLVISYWRDQNKRDRTQDTVVYKLSVHVCEEDDGKPLQISHTPSMSPDDSRKVGLAIKSDHLSIEKLLMQTIEVRTQIKLKDLAKDMQKYANEKCEVRDMPVALHVPILDPCMSSEVLRVAIDIQKGSYLTSVPCDDFSAVHEIETYLNDDRRGLDKLLIKLQMQLCLRRCEKSVQLLPAACLSTIPVVNSADHPLEKLGKCKLFIRVPRQANFFLVVNLVEETPRTVSYFYYLLETFPCTADGKEDDIAEDVGVKSYYRAGRFISMDSFSVTHGPFSKIFDDDMASQLDSFTRKRKLFLGDVEEPKAKKQKYSPYMVPELTYLLASCEERIPFIYLGDELNRQGIAHQGIQVEEEGICLCLGILDFPSLPGCSEDLKNNLKKHLLSCKFRIQSKPLFWVVEFLFTNPPLFTTNHKESGSVQRICFNLEMSADNVQKTVTDLLDEWNCMSHLFEAICPFAEIYNSDDLQGSFKSLVEIRSYNYRRIVLAYGPASTSIVTIQWKTDGQFHLTLGTCGQSSTANPHIPVLTHLQHEFNSNKSIAHLVQVLSDTWQPLSSIAKLPTAPVLGAFPNAKQNVSTFTVLPQSATHVRIVFRSTYCIDVRFKSGEVVSIRDGAFSLLDTSRVIEGCNPASGLRAFLEMYVDEKVTQSHGRRRSTTQDDNPPSPIDMDSMDIFMSQTTPTMGSPASRQRQDPGIGGLRFHSNPMTPPSNPHTPASPGASRMPTGVNPSPSTLIGNPSPGTLLTGGSPGNPQLHVPSPSSFVPTPSPQSLGIHMQSPVGSFISPSMVEGGSPYPGSNLAMPSPGTRNWPNSPSVQGPSPASPVVNHPSRVLPQRSWAASVPLLLSHEAFNNMLTPTSLSGAQFLMVSPLERFFGCIFLKKQLSRNVQTEDSLTHLPPVEPGVVMFKVDGLQCKVNLHPPTLQSLQLKVFQSPDCKDVFAAEELQIIEKFFEMKAACPPYKANALTAFSRLLGAPSRILRDCVQIMRLELMPDRNFKWSVQWCLTIPPNVLNFIAPPGTPAVVIKNKMLIVLQFTRIGLNLPSGKEPQSIHIPLLYDIQANNISQVEPRAPVPQQQHMQTPVQSAVTMMLKRFTDTYQNHTECAIFPAVRELMANLVIPVL